MATAKIYLVRHGETDYNKKDIIQGQLDTQLNEVGIEQGRLVAGALRSIPFDIAYTSDLSRATKTVESILAYHPNVPLHKQENLRERFLGELQGKQRYTRLLSLEESMETKQDFTNRTLAWWDETILRTLSSLQTEDRPHHILVTTHGGFTSTLVTTLIRSREVKCAEGVVIYQCLNSSVTIIEIQKDGKGTVLQYGDTSHLLNEGHKTNADEVDGV